MSLAGNIFAVDGTSAQPPAIIDASWESMMATLAMDGSSQPADYAIVEAWYQSNTGHEAAGYNQGDLTPGSLESSYDEQVFEGIIGSHMRVAHDNVTYRGCRVEGGATYGWYTNPTFSSTVTGTLVDSCTFAGGSPPVDKASMLSSNVSGGYGVTFIGCDLSGWSSGVLAQGGAEFKYNWTRDFYGSSVEGAHVSSANAIGEHIRFYRNYLTEGGSNLASIYCDKRTVGDIQITENILNGSGNNNPSYLLFVKSGSYASSAYDVVMGGNWLGDDYQFGRVSGTGVIPFGSNGNVQTDNFLFSDGSPA